MKLSYHHKQEIMREFPIIELSYEKRIHKKVHTSDFFIIVPKGEKYFAWFRQYKNHYICFLMLLENRNKIKDIRVINASFKKDICFGKGTIVYGTLFNYNNNTFFSIEDIFYFKEVNVSSFSQMKKFDIIHQLLDSNIKQVLLSKNTIIFGLPIIKNNFGGIQGQLNDIAYNIYNIQHRMWYKNRPYLNQFIEQKSYAIFKIKANVSPDIYDTYCYDNQILVHYGVLHIPNYSTSVMMNNLFRDIKENNNLDTLEESDDEDEFENISEDKYVYLEKSYKLRCVYNTRFKRWVPLTIANKPKINLKEKILQMEKK